MQLPFLTCLFQHAKEKGIHTCLDTSGIAYTPQRAEEFAALFKVTDLVLLDIKHSNEEGHRALTAQSQKPVWAFGEALGQAGVPVVVRHVFVPGITDGHEHLLSLGRQLRRLRTLKGLEVLPYHTMGVVKYEQLGIPYKLEGVPAMDKSRIPELRTAVLRGMKVGRSSQQ